MLPEGSEAGFRRFLNGEVIAAALHFHDVSAPGADANLGAVSSQTRFYDCVLIGFAARTQGFLVAPGNPLKIATIGDALAAKARRVIRPQGAGAQQFEQRGLCLSCAGGHKHARAEGMPAIVRIQIAQRSQAVKPGVGHALHEPGAVCQSQLAQCGHLRREGCK